MDKMQCHFRGCERKARKGWTTCPRHGSAGMSRKQWNAARKQRATRGGFTAAEWDIYRGSEGA